MTGNIDESTTRDSSDETFTIYSAMSDAFATQVLGTRMDSHPVYSYSSSSLQWKRRGPPKPVLETRGSTRFRVLSERCSATLDRLTDRCPLSFAVSVAPHNEVTAAQSTARCMLHRSHRSPTAHDTVECETQFSEAQLEEAGGAKTCLCPQTSSDFLLWGAVPAGGTPARRRSSAPS